MPRGPRPFTPSGMASSELTPSPEVQASARRIRLLLDRRKRTLTFYRDLGREVRNLGVDVYGHGLVRRLAKALNTLGLNENTLRKAARFSSLTHAGQLDLTRLRRLGIAWRNASLLTAADLSNADRRQLLDRVAAGKLAATKLGGEVRKKLSKMHVDNHRKIDTARHRAVAAIEQLQRASRSGSERAAAALTSIKQLLRGTQK